MTVDGDLHYSVIYTKTGNYILWTDDDDETVQNIITARTRNTASGYAIDKNETQNIISLGFRERLVDDHEPSRTDVRFRCYCADLQNLQF
ncbi:hypothetical protein QTP88_002453 [Uroleucon formosanum]